MNRDVAAERAEIDRAIDGQTVLTIFEETCARHPDAEAARWREAGPWRSSTWSQYRGQVRRATAGLKDAGFKPGEFGLIMTRNRPEHLVADLAYLHAGGTPVSLYNTLAPNQVEYIANHCRATFAVVEDADFYSKFKAIRGRLPGLRTIAVIERRRSHRRRRSRLVRAPRARSRARPSGPGRLRGLAGRQAR